MALSVMLKILLKQGRHNADWSIVVVMTCNTLLTSQILPVSMTTQSNKPLFPGTNCCYAFPGAKIFYNMYINYFKVGSYCDLDVIVLCCQQYCCHDNSDTQVSFAETVFLSKSNSFNNDDNDCHCI